jgi:TPP-dependent 2-oxoacid decarboxylase
VEHSSSSTIKATLSVRPILFNHSLLEKFIHGVDRQYNEVNSDWDYSLALSYFGDRNGKKNTYSIRTEDELDQVLSILSKDDEEGLRFVVVDLDPMDSPRMLRRLAELRGRVRPNGEIYDP